MRTLSCILFFIIPTFIYGIELTLEAPLKKENSRRERKKRADEIKNNLISEIIEFERELDERVERKLAKEVYVKRQRRHRRILDFIHGKVESIFEKAAAKRVQREHKFNPIQKKIAKTVDVEKSEKSLSYTPLRKENRLRPKVRGAYLRKKSKVKENKADVLSLPSYTNASGNIRSFQLIEEDFNSIKQNLKLKQNEKALIVYIVDKSSQQMVPGWIALNVFDPNKKKKDPVFKYQQKGTAYIFNDGALIHYQTPVFSYYQRENGYLSLKEKFQILKIELSQWCTPSLFDYQGFKSDIKLELNAFQYDLETSDALKFYQNQGYSYVGFSHPIKLKDKFVKQQKNFLPYHVLYQMNLTQKEKDSAWLCAQNFEIENLKIKLYGVNEEFKLKSKSSLAKLIEIMSFAKKNNAVTLFSSLNSMIKVKGKIFPALTFLMLSGLDPDLVSIRNEADVLTYLKLSEMGLKSGFVWDENILEALPHAKKVSSVAHHIRLDKKEKTKRLGLMEALKNAKLVYAKDSLLNFYIKGEDGKIFKVGDSIGLSDQKQFFTPKVEFIGPSGKEYAYSGVELWINAKKYQPTFFKAPLKAGIAVFSKLKLKPGDKIRAKLNAKNKFALTNAIKVKSENQDHMDKGQLSLKLTLNHSHQGNFKMIIKAMGFYKHFSGAFGHPVSVQIPLDSVIDIYDEALNFKRVRMMDLLFKEEFLSLSLHNHDIVAFYQQLLNKASYNISMQFDEP